MSPRAALLSCGNRLHLQHGPIDLIIGADGDRASAFHAAQARFETILPELVGELDILKFPVSSELVLPQGAVAWRMIRAVAPHSGQFVTPMAAVAGSVADEVLSAMITEADLRRAYVNNGGDIAIHLAQGESFAMAISSLQGQDLGRLTIDSDAPVRGIATSGQGGRSLSRGIADSVTVLAQSASMADAAATLIANAVDLPDHPAVERKPAQDVREDSELGDIPIVTHCGDLSYADKMQALRHGLAAAEVMLNRNLIQAAALFLQGESVQTPFPELRLQQDGQRHHA